MREFGTTLSTRREFIKAASAVGATSLGAGALLKSTLSPGRALANGASAEGRDRGEEIFPGVCQGYCNNGCFLNMHVKDGVLVRTSARDLPDNDYKRICHKGYTLPMRVYSPQRVLHPLRRVDGSERGAGEWEQITWEEAIDEVSSRWQAIIDENGPEAMATHSLSGSFSVMAVGSGWSPFNRFSKLLGATTLSLPVDAATNFSLTRMVGTGYFHTANEPKDVLNANTIFIWGANPTISQLNSWHFIAEARAAGAKLIVIDPVFNTNGALADQYVPIKSATDGALALGMMNAVVENGWQDTVFLAAHSCAPFLVKEDTNTFLRLSDLDRAEAGSEDDAVVVMDAQGNFDVPENVAEPVLEGTVEVAGTTATTAYSLLLERIAEWPVSRASEVTGLPEDTIVELARMYACDGPTYNYTFFGTDHYYNGHWNAACMGALAILTGQLGKHGAQIGVPGTTGASPWLNAAGVQDVPCASEARRTIVGTRLNEILNEGTYLGEPFTLRGLYCQGGNPIGNRGDRNDTIEVFKKLDFIVVADMVMSETAQYADIVLPVSFWFEHEDIRTAWIGHPHIMHCEKAVEPLGESKSDFEIQKLILDKMGYGEYMDMSEAEWGELVLDTDACRDMRIDYPTLVDQQVLRAVPTKDDTYVFGEGGIFPTDTGRAYFFIENPKPSNDDPSGVDLEKEYLPYWEGPCEIAGGNSENPDYPFQFMTEHPRMRTHTQWFDVEALREIDPEQFIYINPDDAADLGIASGDEVKVGNARGYLVGHAQVRPNNPRGIVSAVKGWVASQVIDGHLSNTTPTDVNPFCSNQPFNDNAVIVEKI